MYSYAGGGPIMDLVWHTEREDGTLRSQIAIAEADKRLVVLDVTTCLAAAS